MRRPTAVFVAFLSLFVLVGLDHTIPARAQSTNQVSISGTSINVDGKPFIAKGAIFQVFVEVEKLLEACRQTEEYCERHIEARDFYFGRGKFQGQSGLDIAKNWGINTIRLNVNQAALDPSDRSYSQDYVKEITEAAELARQKGFVVIMALFDARNTNAPESLMMQNPRTPIDNDVTLAAAKVLAQKFGKDRGVMLELLNEPFSPTKRALGWKLWRDGGTVKRGRFAGMNFVGVNAVIKAIRDAGAQNVILVQGLGMSFEGFPGEVRDPLNQVVYSVHPMFRDGQPKNVDWDDNFGAFAKSHPVMISAFGVTWRRGWCDVAGHDKPRQLLQYLNDKHIGLVVYALDVPGMLLRDFRKTRDQPTTLGATCAARGNIGDLVKNYFKGGALPAQ